MDWWVGALSPCASLGFLCTCLPPARRQADCPLRLPARLRRCPRCLCCVLPAILLLDSPLVVERHRPLNDVEAKDKAAGKATGATRAELQQPCLRSCVCTDPATAHPPVVLWDKRRAPQGTWAGLASPAGHVGDATPARAQRAASRAKQPGETPPAVGLRRKKLNPKARRPAGEAAAPGHSMGREPYVPPDCPP